MYKIWNDDPRIKIDLSKANFKARIIALQLLGIYVGENESIKMRTSRFFKWVYGNIYEYMMNW